MALFKIFRGDEADLAAVSKTDGYAYFCPDTGNFFIDANMGTEASPDVQRIQVNGLSAQNLSDGTTTIEIDDIVLTSDVIAASQGGTGLATLTANAVLTGNGTGNVKLVSTASGALYATATNGAAQFGTLPIAQGGTAATTAAAARTNLSVYSQTETDNKVTKITPKQYTYTLASSSWSGSSAPYTYTYTNTAITCGSDGTISPHIAPVDGTNLTEYYKITSATATAGTGIVFTAAEKKPSADISVIIQDFGTKVS